MTEARKEAQKIKIVIGDVWESAEEGHKLEIIDYSEKHKIVTFKVNDWLENKEAPALQVQMGIVRAKAKLVT